MAKTLLSAVSHKRAAAFKGQQALIAKLQRENKAAKREAEKLRHDKASSDKRVGRLQQTVASLKNQLESSEDESAGEQEPKQVSKASASADGKVGKGPAKAGKVVAEAHKVAVKKGGKAVVEAGKVAGKNKKTESRADEQLTSAKTMIASKAAVAASGKSGKSKTIVSSDNESSGSSTGDEESMSDEEAGEKARSGESSEDGEDGADSEGSDESSDEEAEENDEESSGDE